MTKAGTSALSAHRRPLITAAAAGGVLTALCFLPSAYASPDRAEAAPAHGETVTSATDDEQGAGRTDDSARPERVADKPGSGSSEDGSTDGADKPKPVTDRPDAAGGSDGHGKGDGSEDREDREEPEGGKDAEDADGTETGTGTGAEAGTEAGHRADERANRSAGRDDDGRTDSARAESAQKAVASDGSDPTPYIVGGLGLLGAGSAVLLARSPRTASGAAEPRERLISPDTPGSPTNTGIPGGNPSIRHTSPSTGSPNSSDG